MIEIISPDRCIRCDICTRVCPADVFTHEQGELPLIARQSDCQTCFLCEIYCPVDALYVAEKASGPIGISLAEVEAAELFGSYARALGWSRGRSGGSEQDPSMHLRTA